MGTVVSLIGKSGSGKALADTENVLTSSGWKKMKDITTNDYVIGSDGKGTKVLSVHPQGNRDIYKISFFDGTSVECDLEHLWTVKVRGFKTLKTLTVEEMLKKPISKNRLDKRYGTYQNEYTYGIPLSSPCEYGNDDAINIDPYLLGLLLGDGGFTGGSIKFTNSNIDIINEIEKRLPKGVKISQKNFRNGAYHISLVKTEKQLRNPLIDELKKLGLYDHLSIDKFIPDIYKNGTLYTRRAIIKGLIDTDGCIKNGILNEYSSSSHALAKDFMELALSIGMKMSSISSREPIYSSKGEKKKGHTSYRLRERTGRAKYKSIVSIDFVRNDKTTCLTIENDDHLFVANGFNLTHNSTSFRTLLKDDGTFIDNVFMIRMGKKPLPFKNRLQQWNKDKQKGDFVYVNDGDTAAAVFSKFSSEYGKKIIIVDDSTFAMTDYFMETALEVGFTKFSINAQKYYNMLKAAEATADDVRVYVVNHTEEDSNGNLKVKTIGKMLDEKVDIPSLLTVVLQAERTKDGYKMKTNQDSGRDIAKSPMDMFSDLYIDNDLKAIDDTICDYYGYEKIK